MKKAIIKFNKRTIGIIYFSKFTEEEIINCKVYRFLDEEGNTKWNCQIYIPYILIKFTHSKDTFEDALLDGIKEAIKFIKEKATKSFLCDCGNFYRIG